MTEKRGGAHIATPVRRAPDTAALFLCAYCADLVRIHPVSGIPSHVPPPTRPTRDVQKSKRGRKRDR